LIESAGLPIVAPNLGVERYLDLMSHDKKAQSGRLRFILLERLGEAYIAESTPQDLVRMTLDAATG
jgi:3-dehydroquinate synthase